MIIHSLVCGSRLAVLGSIWLPDKDRHDGKKHQHRQIHASGDPVAAGDIVRKRSFLHDHGQHEFGSEQ